MFYNPNTKELADRLSLCRRFNMSIPRTASRFTDTSAEEWVIIDETVPSGDGLVCYIRTSEVESRPDGTYGYRYDEVDVPPRNPSDDVTIEDRVAALEDGLAEMAELLVEVL